MAVAPKVMVSTVSRFSRWRNLKRWAPKFQETGSSRGALAAFLNWRRRHGAGVGFGNDTTTGILLPFKCLNRRRRKSSRPIL